MDISPRAPSSQNVVSRRQQQHLVDINLFLLLLILAWSITFLFRRQIQNPNVHCATIIGIIIAVCTNPRYYNEVSEDVLEFVGALLQLMISFLVIEMNRGASRRQILPATLQQNQETNN
ncbi:unnamed protein product [Caenorhabditis angaria]|uniref:Uncharacterized protein n=1 Tax=Caenorhabditis angaria TaxID=860376 RepID=A0A9P1IKY7_9PELO|nr:unnamed protein product [Caenorhabditis angaria]